MNFYLGESLRLIRKIVSSLIPEKLLRQCKTIFNQLTNHLSNHGNSILYNFSEVTFGVSQFLISLKILLFKSSKVRTPNLGTKSFPNMTEQMNS